MSKNIKNEFLAQAEKTGELNTANKSKLRKYADQLSALDEGGKIKVDREAGGISCSKSVKNREYEKTSLFKTMIGYLGEFPPLKLIYDILYFYIKKRSKISGEILPELMQQLGVREATLDDGRRIIVDTDYYISVSDEEEFFKWLRKKGYSDHIKANLAIQDEDFDAELKAYLKERGLSYEKKTSIHWQTRNKIIRDRIAGDEELPEERVLSVTPYEKAEVK